MLSNWTGFLLVVSAGLCWIGIGISVSICARRGWNYDLVQGLNYFGAALVCGVLLACHAWPSASSSKILALVFLMNSLAGIANFYTYVLTAKAMRIGPNGLIWGIMQAGMIGFATFTLPGLIRKRECGGKGEWISAVILMVLNTAASCFLFYKGLDLLAGSGAGGLGYPVAIGVCVAGFSLYSLLFLKEKFARLSLGGLIAVCLGIIIITLK